MIFRILTVLTLVFLAFGCASYGKVVLEDDSGSVSVEVDKRPLNGHYDGTRYEIPPGHMPPPGSCRIWYPGKPPGQQPPPGNCQELRRQVPPGAMLIGH